MREERESQGAPVPSRCTKSRERTCSRSASSSSRNRVELFREHQTCRHQCSFWLPRGQPFDKPFQCLSPPISQNSLHPHSTFLFLFLVWGLVCSFGPMNLLCFFAGLRGQAGDPLRGGLRVASGSNEAARSFHKHYMACGGLPAMGA